MSRNSPTLAGFRRTSVGEQVAAALRDAIRSGVWVKVLPGEIELARQWRASRDSIRWALAQLAKEGLVAIHKGRRTRLCARPRRPVPSRPPLACLFALGSSEVIRRVLRHPLLLELHTQLSEHGIGWEERLAVKIGFARRNERLRRLVASRPGACWLLWGAPAEVQRWFQQADVKVLGMGSCFPGIRIPHVDIDNRAVGWHAAGRMVHSGHRHIALVLPLPTMPGDLACRDGFVAYANACGRPITVTELVADSSHAAFKGKLNALLARRPRPTAILSMHPENTLRIFSHVLFAGLRIPGDVSLISRDSHSLLESGVPEITCYSNPTVKIARRMAKIVLALLAGQSREAAAPNLVMPAFVPGETLAAPPR